MHKKLGVRELEGRLVKAASDIGFQVLLGDKLLTSDPSWDRKRRADFHRRVSQHPRKAWGICDYRDQVIWLDPRINQQHRLSVLVHELGHALLHNQYKIYRPRQWEAEAEQVRCLVGQAVGIALPRNGNDFDRLSWLGRRKALRRGRRASNRLLRAIAD